MADISFKDKTTAPLLHMPVGTGLTLNPPEQENFLVPVVQSSSFNEEEVDLDSFVGQASVARAEGHRLSSGMWQSEPIPLFESVTPESTFADPFAGISGNSAPRTVSLCALGSDLPPQPMLPSVTAGVVTEGQLPASQDGAMLNPLPLAPDPCQVNVYRQKGPMRHALPSHPPASSCPSSLDSLSSPSITMVTESPFGNRSLPPGYSPSPFIMAGLTSGPECMNPANAVERIAYSPTGLREDGYSPCGGQYQPLPYHWFHCRVVGAMDTWLAFSRKDSTKLEEQFLKEQGGAGRSEGVGTDGGRYNVDIMSRQRRAVYWAEEPTVVMRCLWFYKRGRDNVMVPFDEECSGRLEVEYRRSIQNNKWNTRVQVGEDDTVMMHNPDVFIHFTPSARPDEFGNFQSSQTRPRVVKRGVDGVTDVQEGESDEVDHLVFVLHGIGDSCDLRFRNIVQCVDDLRAVSNELIASHYQQYLTTGHVHRVEFLPVHWHQAVRSEAIGVDRRLKSITLPSTRRLREFINDNLLDVLFYTSPTFCQIICDTVGQELNRIFRTFLARNPTFGGDVSVAGHSLGASILFDLLQHQLRPGECVAANGYSSLLAEEPHVDDGSCTDDVLGEESKVGEGEPGMEQLLDNVGLTDMLEVFRREQIDLESLEMCSEQDLKDLGLPMGPRKKLQLLLAEGKKTGNKARRVPRIPDCSERAITSAEKMDMGNQRLAASSVSVDYICGPAGTGQPSVRYPSLEFSPSCLFALGSPIGVFLSIRGVQLVGEDFKLPTCPRFLNIFHPAYRMEPLISPSLTYLKPVLVPHHKGRKRMHLELKETISRVGSDLKQKIFESLRSTWNSINDFARAHRSPSSELPGDDDVVRGLDVGGQVESVVSQIVEEQQRNEMTEGSDPAEMWNNISNVANSPTLVGGHLPNFGRWPPTNVVAMTDYHNPVGVAALLDVWGEKLGGPRAEILRSCACSRTGWGRHHHHHDASFSLGQLNEGRRVDYVLQEKPIESFNHYLFALSSHGCYWTSEDTALLLLGEIYSPLGIHPVTPGPPSAPLQPNQSGSRGADALVVPPHHDLLHGSGVRAFAPPGQQALPGMPASCCGPPPMSGFVKKSALK